MWEEETPCNTDGTSVAHFFLSGHDSQLAYWKVHLEDSKPRLMYSISKSESVFSIRPI